MHVTDLNTAMGITYPDVLDRYKCKCGSCRRSCCGSDWDIAVSRAEYERAVGGGLGDTCTDLAIRGLVRCAEEVRDGVCWAVCKTRPDGRCALQDPDGRCAWQKATGSCIGKACNEFPTTTVRVGDGSWRFATLACEAVVEALLGREDPIRVVHGRADVLCVSDPGAGSPVLTISDEDIHRRPLLGLYPRLVDWGMSLLQDRNLPLGDRLVLLTQFMYRVQWLEEEGRIDRLVDEAEGFLLPASRKRSLADVAPAGAGANARLTYAAKVLSGESALALPRRDFSLSALSGMGFSFENPLVSDAPREASAKVVETLRLEVPDMLRHKRTRLMAALESGGRGAFLEHVCVCEYLRTMTPLTQGGVWESTALFIGWYSLIETCLAAVLPDGFGDEEMVDAVVRVQRIIAHGLGRADGILDWMSRVGMDAPSAVAVLARS